MDISLPNMRRGGSRSGCGRARRTGPIMRIRLEKSQHERWTELKMRGALQTDNDVARYLLDLADIADQKVVPSCAPLMSTPEPVKSAGRHVHMQAALRVVHPPRTLIPALEMSAIEESSHAERSKSILSKSLPHLVDHPFADDEVDETYVPDTESDSESDYSSSEDEAFIQSAVTILNDSGSEQHSEEEFISGGDTDEDPPPLLCTEIQESAKFHTSSPPAFSAGCEKVIVSVSQLLQLLPPRCYNEECRAALSTQQQYKGGVLVLSFSCSVGHRYTWSSSAESVSASGNRIHTNNILLAAACVLSGNSFEKLKQLFKFLGLVTITNRTFYRYQSALILPVVEEFWKEHLSEVHAQLQGRESVLVGGDGRCDSPSSSAKYCTYTLMESETKQILHSETVTRDMVQYKSPNMEREALRRSLGYLATKVKITELVTDASTSIIAMMARDFPHVYHSLDVWHKAKKLRKSLLEASKTKGMGVLQDWSDNIVNHFWWCCEHCDADVGILKNKSISVLHHVSDEHEWTTGKCDHDALTEPPKNQNGQVISYIRKEDPAFQSLQKIVLDQRWLQTMKYYTLSRHTGLLESYHNLILAYIPKRFGHGDESYTARVHLAALDHNCHCHSEPRKSHDGTPQMRRVWRKRTKRWVAIPVKEPKEFSYIPEIILGILRRHRDQTEPLRAVLGKRRQVKITPVAPPSTAELVAKRKSRFSPTEHSSTK